MKDLTGKVVFYLYDDFEGDLSVSQVKLTRHKDKGERDMKDEDEYEGEVVKHVFGKSKLEPEVLYVSDMVFLNKDLIRRLWEMLNY